MGEVGVSAKTSWSLNTFGSATCAKCKYRFFGCPFTIQSVRYKNHAQMMMLHLESIDDKYAVYTTMEHQRKIERYERLPNHMCINNHCKFIGLNINGRRTDNPSQIFEHFVC